MDILKNETIKNAAAVLWHKFLLAETVNDIILSEIKRPPVPAECG